MHSNRGVSLIIVIFAVMIFAVLGGTLAALLSIDFDANLRSFDSERALYIAEAGAQWALRQLKDGFSCASITGSTFPHKIGGGEYSCACDASTGPIIVDATGYIPSQADPRAVRIVRITAAEAVYTNAVTGADLFDWNDTAGYPVSVDGVVESKHFEGQDADLIPDNTPSDFNVPPLGMRTPNPNTVIPAINITYWTLFANTVKGKVFGDPEHPVNITFDNKGNYQNDWLYVVYGNVTIDATKGNVVFEHTGIIATGNITIIGTNTVRIVTHVDNPNPNKAWESRTIPNLATSAGDIISTYTPANGTNGRDFDGLLYSQAGIVRMNYIRLRGGIMGQSIKLSGQIDVKYDKKYLDKQGFSSAGESMTTWQEQ